MGLMDMFQNAGNSLIESLTPKKKPGELCIASCTINDIRCEACLAEQEKIRAALDELQNLESAVENARNNPQTVEKLPAKCSVCGAPFEKGEQSCPYCGNKYSVGTFAANIPATEAEQDNLLLQKAAETYAMYANIKKRVSENKSDDLKGKLPSFLGGAASMLYTTKNKFADMTPQQIKQLARQNNVSYREYITGVMQGAYQSAGDIKLRQISQQMSELSEQRRNISMEYNAKQQQENQRYRAEQQRIQSESNAKLQQMRQQHRQEEAKRQSQMAAWRTPQYSGGPGPSTTGSCCGNCRYYMVHDNKCIYNEFKHPTGANDYCSSHINI